MKAKPEVYRVEFVDDRPALLLHNRKEFKSFVDANRDAIEAVYQLEWRSIAF